MINVSYCHIINDDLKFFIIEQKNPIIIENFNNRYQIFANYKDNILFPQKIFKYLHFKSNDNDINSLFLIQSELNNSTILINKFDYYEKQICCDSLEFCENYIQEYLNNSNQKIYMKNLINDYFEYYE